MSGQARVDPGGKAERKCNLGCGPDTREGWVNVDQVPLPGMTVRADLAHIPHPFKDSVFDFLEARHLLEHLPDVVLAVEEFHRVCKPNARVYIEVPYWNSDDAHADPTHRHFFTEHSFDYFTEGRKWSGFNYYSRARFHIDRIEYKFNESPYLRWIPRRLGRKLAKYIGNIVVAVGFHLRVVK